MIGVAMLDERLRANAWYYRTVPDLFLEACRAHPDKTAITFEHQPIAYGELERRVHRACQGLRKLGVEKGDVVSLLPSPTPEFVYVYFGALQAGAVVNPLNLLWGVPEFHGVLQRNDPKVIVTVDTYGGRDYIGLLREAIAFSENEAGAVASESVPNLRGIVAVSRSGDRHEPLVDFADFLETGGGYREESMVALARSGAPTDVQYICQTSGTTGLSKSALWCHRPPLASVHFGARHLNFTEDDGFINLAPFYHNSGMFALNMTLALAGATLHLMEKFDPGHALELIDRYKPTCTFGFDAHWQGMRRVPGFEDHDFTITKALLAGEPRTYDLVTSMCPEGAIINQLYAQTENGPGVAFGEPDCMDYRIRKHTHGRPLPGVELVIKDLDTGERVPQGQPGEICYRSPYMFSGYLKQPEATEKDFDAEGYFHSGDFGTIDNGYVTFLGRLGGVVKSGGENVSTVRVTNLLLECLGDEIDDAKTVGIPDEYWGTKVVSLVRFPEGRKARSTEELREACKGTLAAYEIPRAFVQWQGEWPTTPEGKIDFKALEAYAAERAVTS